MLANTLTELSRRKVFRALAMYVMAALALTEAADVAMGQFPNLPGWTVRAVIIVALAGLPLVAVFAWSTCFPRLIFVGPLATIMRNLVL